MTPDDDDTPESERETLSGRALAWVETLRKADAACIEGLHAELSALRKTETELLRKVGVASVYVQSVLAIRAAPYPSQEFTQAITRASEAYHDLLAAFGA
jgi:hypothetical protein